MNILNNQNTEQIYVKGVLLYNNTILNHVLERNTGSSDLCNLRPLQVLINIVTEQMNEKTKIKEQNRRC